MFRDHVLGPFSHFFWANPFSDQFPHTDRSFLATMRRSPGSDPSPNKPTPLEDNSRKSFADSQDLQSPEDADASARDSLVSKLGRHPEHHRSQLEHNPDKRPLDSVGSGFMKKAQADGMDMAKRPLDSVGSGFMKKAQANGMDMAKRPLDSVGSGFMKKAQADGMDMAKRPLDSVGSGFMKKAQADGMDMAKRDLDRLGSGLMKRPLDRLGSGFLKKRFPFSEDPNNPFDKRDPEEDFPHVNSDPSPRFEEKQKAVEMIKKGLDHIGIGLLKREDDHPEILAQIRQGLEELSTSLGNGSPTKEVDVDMVRRGLDHLGSGLLKRGLDTVGIGLLKRGIDNLDVGLSKNAPSRFLRLEGLGLLKKGLQDLAVVMRKHGFSTDAVNLITTGTEKLASWLVSHRPSSDFPDSREPQLAKKDLDPEFQKKSFDEIGSGFLKKDLVKKSDDDVESADQKSFEEVKKELENELAKKRGKKLKSAFRTNSLDRIGTGFIKRASLQPEHRPSQHATNENSPDKSSAGIPKNSYKHVDKMPDKKPLHDKKDSSSQKMPEHSKTPAQEENPDPKAAWKMQTLSKAEQSEDDIKESRYKSKLPVKKDLDEIGIGLIKKDLDYIGAGLIRKRKLQPDSEQFQGSVPSPHQGKPLWHQSGEEKTQNGKYQAPEVPRAGPKSNTNQKRLASMKA